MPSLSSLLGGSKQPAQPPGLIFHSPDAQGNIRATNAQNQELACFTVSKDTLTRIRPNQQQICTYHKSSWSGSTTLNIHNQQIKMKEVLESLQSENRADMDTPLGKMKWRPNDWSEKSIELRDSRKVLLARGSVHGTLNVRGGDLEVFVPGDEFLLDLILASWLGLFKAQEIDAKDVKHAADILDAVGQIAGG